MVCNIIIILQPQCHDRVNIRAGRSRPEEMIAQVAIAGVKGRGFSPHNGILFELCRSECTGTFHSVRCSEQRGGRFDSRRLVLHFFFFFTC